MGFVPRAGTEVYDMSDDEDDDEDAGPVSIHSLAAKANRAATPKSNFDPRLARPKTEINRFNGVELTSIINMIDLEGGEGSRPLVDLNIGPKLDSGPRLQLDSGPRAQLADSGPSVLPTLKGVGAIQDDVAPTAPRTFPPTNPGTTQLPRNAPFPPPSAQRPAFPQMPPQAPRTQSAQRSASASRRAISANRKRSKIRPWMVILAIAIIAIVVTLIVAMSGPGVPPTGK
jgi:hypothetical protein